MSYLELFPLLVRGRVKMMSDLLLLLAVEKTNLNVWIFGRGNVVSHACLL